MKTTLQAHIEFLKFQRNELTGHYVYLRLANAAKRPHNQRVLMRLAEMEYAHAEFWMRHTSEKVLPHTYAVYWYPFIAKVFGITFAIRMFERRIAGEIQRYHALVAALPDIAPVLEDEEEHENNIIEMLRDPVLINTSSIVLGLNDALVELTGAMAGFTFALGHTRIIAVAGFITGFSAALSMTASEYLSTKTEEGNRNPFVAALFTGITYFVVVLLFIAPYIFIINPYIALGILSTEALAIVALFSFYRSVVRGISFWKQFFEMALISLFVALLTFAVAYAIRVWLGIRI